MDLSDIRVRQIILGVVMVVAVSLVAPLITLAEDQKTPKEPISDLDQVQPRDTIIRDHRTGSPQGGVSVTGAAPTGPFAHFHLVGLQAIPKAFGPGTPLTALNVVYFCFIGSKNCDFKEHVDNVRLEIYHAIGAEPPRLVGLEAAVQLLGNGKGCDEGTFDDNLQGCFRINVGQLRVTTGTFTVKLIKDNAVISNMFPVVPVQLKIGDPLVRDHR